MENVPALDKIFSDNTLQERKDLLMATADQLAKDFKFCGKQILPGNNNLPDLLMQVSAIVKQMVNEEMDKFLSLLYRIDLDENHFRTIIAQNNGNFEEIISAMIIEREMRKVLTRQSQFYK